MYEGGRATALSAQIVGKLCDELGLVPPTQAELAAEVAAPSGTRSFCPNPECPGNLPVTIGGRVALVPHAHLAGERERHCAWCGEVLEKACPECGAPVNPGAFCACCGTPYLAEAPERVDPVRVASSERLMAWSH